MAFALTAVQDDVEGRSFHQHREHMKCTTLVSRQSFLQPVTSLCACKRSHSRCSSAAPPPSRASEFAPTGTCPTSRKNRCQAVLFVTPSVLQQPHAPPTLPKRCGQQSVGHPWASPEHATIGGQLRSSASLSFLASGHSPPQPGARRAAPGHLPLYSWIEESKPQPIRSANVFERPETNFGSCNARSVGRMDQCASGSSTNPD